MSQRLSKVRITSSVLLVILLRSALFTALICIIDQFLPLGTSPLLVSFGAFLGVVLATVAAASKLRTLGFYSILVAGAVLSKLSLYLATLFALDQVFKPFTLYLHFELAAWALCASAILTWMYWRVPGTISLELVIIAATVITLLSGHRNFHFDNPRILTELAWSLGINHLTLLVGLGAGVVGLLITYLYVGVFPGRPVLDPWARPQANDRGRSLIKEGLVFFVALVAIFTLVSREIYRHYSQDAASRLANGVGQEKKEGMSPLGFHSALGSTNQPAALLRLEGDYKNNPFSPMLYLREGALSSFNGRELVIAPGYLDKDVNQTSPDEAYNGNEDIELSERTSIIQSIFPLADHKTAFALDYPISIRPLKNPNPGRFRAAYRVYSMAPNFPLQSLVESEVGDERWPPDIKQHYLEPHADARYGALAMELTKDFPLPIQKANAITQYLSKTAIYTLTPNHTTKPGDDPVAPFLFGDNRGYCVHFAHAMVYMFRSLGIPARIGTGYLTDLSQAKDGHVLLRMSDRHAWAEIYIRGRGWVPFDVQPEKVESHAETEVDQKLLEELMGMVGPGEEVLPGSALENEPNVEPPPPFVTPRKIGATLVFLFVLFIGLKLTLRYSYLLPGDGKITTKRAVRSLASLLTDLGFSREHGETFIEYQRRLAAEGIPTLALAIPLAETRRSELNSVTRAEALAKLAQDKRALKVLPWWRRGLAVINPSSVISLSMGGTW